MPFFKAWKIFDQKDFQNGYGKVFIFVLKNSKIS